MTDFDSADLHDFKLLLSKAFQEDAFRLISVQLGDHHGLDSIEFLVLANVHGYLNSKLIWSYIREILRGFFAPRCRSRNTIQVDLDAIRRENYSPIEKDDETTIHAENVQFAFRMNENDVYDALESSDPLPTGFFDVGDIERGELL